LTQKTEKKMKSAYYSRNQSYSRSYNAELAESVERFPLTRAISVVALKYGVTKKIARFALEFTGTSEWHHVGKFANRVDYYDTSDQEVRGHALCAKREGLEAYEARLVRRQKCRPAISDQLPTRRNRFFERDLQTAAEEAVKDCLSCPKELDGEILARMIHHLKLNVKAASLTTRSLQRVETVAKEAVKAIASGRARQAREQAARDLDYLKAQKEKLKKLDELFESGATETLTAMSRTTKSGGLYVQIAGIDVSWHSEERLTKRVKDLDKRREELRKWINSR
jgi:hypothetical protein